MPPGGNIKQFSNEIDFQFAAQNVPFLVTLKQTAKRAWEIY